MIAKENRVFLNIYADLLSPTFSMKLDQVRIKINLLWNGFYGEESITYRIIQNNQDVIVNHDETDYLSQL